MTSRRSFLALIAATLAVPAELLKPAPVLRKGDILPVKVSANPVLKDWWRHYAVWDTVTLEPGRETSEVLFSSPIPQDFVIQSIGWAVKPEILVDDLDRILQSAEFRLACDGQDFCSGRLVLLGSGLGFGLNDFPIMPALAPRGDFRLDVLSGPLTLSEPIDLMFTLRGSVNA